MTENETCKWHKCSNVVDRLGTCRKHADQIQAMQQRCEAAQAKANRALDEARQALDEAKQAYEDVMVFNQELHF